MISLVTVVMWIQLPVLLVTPYHAPDNAKCLDSCHRRQKFEQQLSPDHHLLAQASGGLEMKCADCHTAKQMHGDGQAYSSLHNNPTKVDSNSRVVILTSLLPVKPCTKLT